MKTTVVYHRSDNDGIFCREIARRFIPDAELIGWNFGDQPLPFPVGDNLYIVLDLPMDRPFGLKFEDGWLTYDNPDMEKEARKIQPIDRIDFSRWIWIDHHATSIASHPPGIPGYRIDGVAACRLAYQWFFHQKSYGNVLGAGATILPAKHAYVDRLLTEPWAVQLAGEYDVWDKRDPDAELFQFGLRSRELTESDWAQMVPHSAVGVVRGLLNSGRALQYARDEEYRQVITDQGFDLEFHGLKFLACNSHEADIRSQLFAAGVKPHHDALMGFTMVPKDGGKDFFWRVSIYNAPGKDNDLTEIAKKYGGGGHRGAAGFTIDTLAHILGPYGRH